MTTKFSLKQGEKGKKNKQCTHSTPLNGGIFEWATWGADELNKNLSNNKDAVYQWLQNGNVEHTNSYTSAPLMMIVPNFDAKYGA